MPARACRACLATDIKLYNIYKNNLYEDFGEIVGNPIFESDDLPQHICVMCFALLLKYITFRDRARLSQDLLEEFEQKGIKTTTTFIKTIDRKKCGLVVLNLENFTPIISNLDLEEVVPEPPPEQPPEKPPEELPESDNVGLDQQPEPWCPDVLEPWSPDAFEPWSPGTPPADPNQPSTELQDTTKKKSGGNTYVKTMFDFPKKVEDFQEKYNVDVLGVTRKAQIEEFREKIQQILDLLVSSEIPYCVHCGKRCFNEQHLEKHQTQCHDTSLRFECEICRCRFATEIKLSRHIVLTHMYKVKCRLCGFMSNSSAQARSHASEHGLAPKKTLSCEHCDYTFEDRNSLNAHMQENHMDKQLWCKLCGETSMFDRAMLAHMRWHSKEMEFEHECNKCETMFITKEALDTHLSLTCKEFNCVVCGIHVESKIALRKHVIQQHNKCQGMNLELCSGCGVKFFGADALESHQGDGSCGDGLPCQECGVSCPDVSSLTIHKADNHRTVIRACEDCGIAFDPNNYRKHMLRVHNIKAEVFRPVLPRAMTRVWSVHGGIICSNVAKPASELNNARPYMCDVCAKGFLTRTYLKRHILLCHTNVRPFKCEICHKEFPWKALYEKHWRHTHTADKPYSCKFCPRTFRNRTPLSNHLKTHLNLRPHICHVCGKRFRTSTCIKTHIRAVHLKLPTRGPKKWAMDKELRELQGIVDNELTSNDQEQAETQEQMDESQSHVDESQVFIDESQVLVDESEVLIDESEVLIDESQVIDESQSHIDEFQCDIDESHGHVDDETHTDIRDTKRRVIAPEGYIDSELGVRIYPVKERKRKPFKTDSEKVVVKRRKRNTQPKETRNVEKRQRISQPTVEKITCRLDIAPGKVQFRPVTKNCQSTNIDDNTGEHSMVTSPLPRVIKTINIKKVKKRVVHENAQRTQYVHAQNYTDRTDTQDRNTHSQDVDTHTQYTDDSNVNMVYNTLSRDVVNTHNVSKTKKEVKISKGKSMPYLNLDDGYTHTYTAKDLNTVDNVQDSFDIQDYVNIKKPVNSGGVHTISNAQNYIKIPVSYSKEIILDTKDTGVGKRKYVIVASTSKRKNSSSMNSSGKTGWK